MTKLIITKKEAKEKTRTALYLDKALGDRLDNIAESEGVSFNRLCVILLEHALTVYEANDGEGVTKKKKRSRK